MFLVFWDGHVFDTVSYPLFLTKNRIRYSEFSGIMVLVFCQTLSGD